MENSILTNESGKWEALSKDLRNVKIHEVEIGEFPIGRFDLYYDLAAAVLSNDNFKITGGGYEEKKETYKVFTIEGNLWDVYYRFSIRLWWHHFKMRYRYGILDLLKYDDSSYTLYKVDHYPYYPQDYNLARCSKRIIEYLKENVIKPEHKCDGSGDTHCTTDEQ